MPRKQRKPPADPPANPLQDPKKKLRRSSFAVALGDAEKRLAAAIQKRSSATETVAAMSLEIPRLQGIIRALGGNVDDSIRDVAYLAQAATLGEIPAGAGSIPVNADGTAPPAAAPDLDSLPGMADGEWK